MALTLSTASAKMLAPKAQAEAGPAMAQLVKALVVDQDLRAFGIDATVAEIDDALDGNTATAAEITRVADVSTRIVTLVASGAISLATHEGKTLLLGEVGGNALAAFTLPAATGSGAKYLFKVSVVNTSSYTITTDGTDVFKGKVLTHDADITDGTLLHAFSATTQTILTLNGTTTGGAIIGDWVELEDTLSGSWSVRGIVTCAASSNPATPFS
jgi:hypothetical protein